MNEWVQQQTGGTIRPEIRVQEDDLLRILNTLYFGMSGGTDSTCQKRRNPST